MMIWLVGFNPSKKYESNWKSSSPIFGVNIPKNIGETPPPSDSSSIFYLMGSGSGILKFQLKYPLELGGIFFIPIEYSIDNTKVHWVSWGGTCIPLKRGHGCSGDHVIQNFPAGNLFFSRSLWLTGFLVQTAFLTLEQGHLKMWWFSKGISMESAPKYPWFRLRNSSNLPENPQANLPFVILRRGSESLHI